MKHPIPRRFEYSIPASGAGNDGTTKPDRHSFGMCLPMAKVNIDFETRNLSLEGNGLLKIIPAEKPEQGSYYPERRRVVVKAAIYAGSGIGLAANTEMVFSLEGIIDDGRSINSCSGMLVLDSTTAGNGSGHREWCLAVYLYDDCDTERAIELRLKTYSISENEQLN